MAKKVISGKKCIIKRYNYYLKNYCKLVKRDEATFYMELVSQLRLVKMLIKKSIHSNIWIKILIKFKHNG